MNSDELQRLAKHARLMREIGIGLLIASGLLAALFIIAELVESSIPKQHIIITDDAIPNAFANTQIEAKAAIVYDIATGETLYTKNAEAQLPLASLTKLLTVYAAFEKLSPTTSITIPTESASIDAPHLFSPGQSFSLSELARLTLTASLNDGASAIASATAAREGHTQTEMLASAASALNLSQTYAVNGSGLDASTNVSGGYGSARDIAHLAGALVERIPTIAQATTQSSIRATSENGLSFTVKNTDPIVDSIPRLLLSKTGYTDLAGGNLAIVIDAGIAHPIAIVVLGSSKEARFTDSSALIAATLAHFSGVASL